MADEPVDGEESGTEAEGARNYTLILGLAFFLVLAIGAGLWMQREEGESWTVVADSWEAVALSEDGRTLTFEMWDSGKCDVPDRVEFDGDLEPDTRVTATVYVRYRSDERCSAGRDLVGITVTTELDDPMPEGIILVDGVSSAGDCATVTEQELERGSTLPSSDRIDPC